MKQPPRIIVDGDPAVYRAGFAAQDTHHIYVYEDENGTLAEETVVGDPRDWVKAVLKRGCTILHREDRVIPKDPKIAKLALNAQFKGIYNKCRDHLASSVPPTMEIILSGTGNYREQIATVMGYKANRLKLVKPVHYKTIRDHVIDSWSAALVNGREADDEVAIRMTNARTDGVRSVLVTIDKDLDQIPGTHYDYKNHVFYEVTYEEGILLFYAQALSGDTTDNIPGLRGVGPATARKWVYEWERKWLEQTPVEKRTQRALEEWLWSNVVDCYRTYPLGIPEEQGAYTGEKNAEELALEMARLVWLQRRPGQLWTPPGQEFEEIDSER